MYGYTPALSFVHPFVYLISRYITYIDTYIALTLRDNYISRNVCNYVPVFIDTSFMYLRIYIHD